MNISVLIPTYRRPQDLHRCLDSLKIQFRRADEVIVVVRDSDIETKEFLAHYDAQCLQLKVAFVSVAGVVCAMNLGLDQTNGEIIVLTDDDSMPSPNWLQQIEICFAKSKTIGGVGGKDILIGVNQVSEDIGRLKWWGQVSGNHHLGTGCFREVDVLKGVNCAYRVELLRRIGFDHRLLGRGAQVHWELSLGLTLKRQGWKLIYDPNITVQHFPAQRFDKDKRSFSASALFDMIHNETLVLLEHFSWSQRLIFLLWAGWIGTRAAPGLFHWLLLIVKGDRKALLKFIATMRGRMAGIRASMDRSR